MTTAQSFNTDPIEMPEPLLRDHLAHGAPTSYANTGRWLSVGQQPENNW
ncbi:MULTISPECIES: hypothetical protein [Nocardia]|nr:hypothetical protein [Nocardia sputorum]